MLEWVYPPNPSPLLGSGGENGEGSGPQFGQMARTSSEILINPPFLKCFDVFFFNSAAENGIIIVGILNTKQTICLLAG